MIILDTNTVSEPTKPSPNQDVVDWINEQFVETLFLTATSLAEVRVGVETMPDGRRKRFLLEQTDKLMWAIFGPRILPFDEAAAIAYGSLTAKLRAKGYRLTFGDGQIAAIAMVHGFAVATRDTAPFLAAGLTVINPWELS